jgi:hypothetical protein
VTGRLDSVYEQGICTVTCSLGSRSRSRGRDERCLSSAGLPPLAAFLATSAEPKRAVNGWPDRAERSEPRSGSLEGSRRPATQGKNVAGSRPCEPRRAPVCGRAERGPGWQMHLRQRAERGAPVGARSWARLTPDHPRRAQKINVTRQRGMPRHCGRRLLSLPGFHGDLATRISSSGKEPVSYVTTEEVPR